VAQKETKLTRRNASKKLKELGEVAALVESGTEKMKATSRNASKKLKGKTLETAVATLGEGTASMEKAQGGISSSSNLSYEQQASVLVELCNLVVLLHRLFIMSVENPFFASLAESSLDPTLTMMTWRNCSFTFMNPSMPVFHQLM
jgi:hypothetical protein